MSDLVNQRNIARRLEQTQVTERPGGVTGFTTFYASGVFTPRYEGTGTAGVWTYTTQAGFYTRIGNRCFFNLSITAATRPTPPTLAAVIVGLPFTSDATANSHAAVTLDTIDAITLSGTIVQLTARIPPGTTRIELIEVLGTAPSAAGALLATGLSATATIRISGHYMV
jgi:hypothetical protein